MNIDSVDKIKERALKKYEAQATCVKSSGDTEFYSPFGPMISKTKLSASLLARLNRHGDALLASKHSENQEIVLPETVLADGGEDCLGNLIIDQILRYAETSENTELTEIQIQTAWFVSQYENCSSPTHFHSSDISGVIYLKTPDIKANEEEKSYISGRKSGYINFLSGGKQDFNKSLISFKPVAGDAYLFPGWLLHCAEPFLGTGERRSLAFNAKVSC